MPSTIRAETPEGNIRNVQLNSDKQIIVEGRLYVYNEETEAWIPSTGTGGSGTFDGDVTIISDEVGLATEVTLGDVKDALVTDGIKVDSLPDITVDYTPNTITGGTVTVTTAGKAVPLTATQATVQYIIIQPWTTNTGYGVVGGSDVDKDTGNGIVISNPADANGIKVPTPLPLPFKDPSDVYVDSTVNGDKFHWLALSYVAE